MVCVEQDRDIPLPVVQLNRWVLVVGVVGGLILRQPLLITTLFLVVLSAVLFGRRGSLIFQVGRLLLAKRNAKALNAGEVEDPRLMRFNNTIAVMLLGGAQLAFLLGLEGVGWVLSLAVATAAGVALAGFCVVASSITATERTVFGCLERPRGTRGEVGARYLLLGTELTVRAPHNEREGPGFSSRDFRPPLHTLFSGVPGR